MTFSNKSFVISHFIQSVEMDDCNLTKRQRKRLGRKARDQAWSEKSISPPCVNPKIAKELEKRPRQLAKKAVVSFGKFFGLCNEVALLEQAGEKQEADAKRLEAQAKKAKAVRQFEHAQEVLTSIRVERGLKPPEQKSGLQLIYDKGFYVRSQ